MIDPFCEDGGQESVTPYGYVFNDPIKHNDRDGRFPVWAIVGAGLEYGLQVYDNYKSGKTGYNAWIGNVDFVDVGLSAMNPSGKFKVAKTLLVEGTQTVVDLTANEGIYVKSNVKKVATKTIVNTVVDVKAGKITEAGSNKAVQNSNKEVATANQKLKSAERQADRSPNSPKKAEIVKNANPTYNQQETNKFVHKC